MIMASQFKSLRLPFVMLFTIPVSLIGHRARADGGGAGLLDHGADGHPHGHRHRRLERHPARRRREPRASTTRAPRSSRPSSPAARSRFVPIAMTSLATVIGLDPDRARARARIGGEPAARARGRRGAHVVDDPVALPRAGDVHVLRQADARGEPERSRGALAGAHA